MPKRISAVDSNEAADSWHRICCPDELATALADSGEKADLSTAPEMLDRLGAEPAARLVRQKLKTLGVGQVHVFRSSCNVSRHVPAIFAKLEVHSREEAARVASELGLVDLEEG